MSKGRRGRTEGKNGRKAEKELFQRDNNFKGEKKQNPEKTDKKERKKRSRQTQEKYHADVGRAEYREKFLSENQFQEAENPVQTKRKEKRKQAGIGKSPEQEVKRGKDRKAGCEKQAEAKDNWFTDRDNTFTESSNNAFTESSKSERKRKKAEHAEIKLVKVNGRALRIKEYSWESVFDTKTGKRKYVLKDMEKDKEIPKTSFGKKAVWRPGSESLDFIDNETKEDEQDNAGRKAVFMSGLQLENMFGFISGYGNGKEQQKKQEISFLEKKKMAADIASCYEKYLEENPEIKKKQIRKRIQKQRIKREYVKAYRKKLAEENLEKTISLTKDTVIGAIKKLGEAVKSRIAIISAVSIIFLLVFIIMTLFSSCGAVAGEALSLLIAGSYLSEPEEIDKAELRFTEMEMDLQEEIDSIEDTYPDYDEYRYNLGEIGHNPFTLISYLSSVYIEYTAGEVMAELEQLFQEMYTLSFQPVVEIRTVQVEDADGNAVLDADGNPVMKEVEVKILQVTLEVVSLEEIVAGRMDGEQSEIFAAYTETKGCLQRFDTPLNLYWYSYVSSYYGYRKNPFSGERQLHRGIDIAVPEHTPVYATHNGIVETAAFDSEYGNYVVIRDEKGFTTKYAHLSEVNVVAGQEVASGSQIGLTGNTGSSTGSHLHLEVLFNGIYYNPLFYFDVGEGTLYGEIAGDGNELILPEGYDEESVRRLMVEAEKYIGTPYIFGGSMPGGFDCSGFVSWVFSNSGVHDLPRTTAQGIYEQCVPVSSSEAKPGDIVFFTGTYNAGRPVTHVGIYCGNGIMVHAGDPVQYTSFATSAYWQSHFYGFGRI